MKHLTLREKVGYGLGDLASNIVFATVSTFLMFYYTDVYGISAALVGMLFFITRLWDAVSDPLMGAIGDRTNSRWGKFRPYLLFTPIPLAIVAVLTFTTPAFGESGKVIWAFATYIALMTLYTIINIPYSSLPPMMTSSGVERGQLAGYRMTFAFVGSLMVNAGTIPLITKLGSGNSQLGYQYTMMVFAGVMVLLYFACFSLVCERVPPVQQTASLKDDFRVVLRNRAWWVTVLMGVPIFALMLSPFAVGMYYFTYNVGDVSKAPAFFALATAGLIAGASACIYLVKKICKRILVMAAVACGGLVVGQLIWIDPQQLNAVYSVIFVAQFFMGISAANLWGLVGDMADYIEWQSGRRVVGLATSSATFSHKFGMGLGGAMVGFALAYAGYEAGVEQTVEALFMIKAFMSLVPSTGALLVIAIAYFYPVTRSRLQQLQPELEQQRQARRLPDQGSSLPSGSRLA